MDKAHTNVLLCIEIQWLSRGRDINRGFEIKDELHAYFQEKSQI